MMEALLRLHQDYGWSSHYIAKRTGRNQSDIAQLLGVARNPDLAQLVRHEVIKPTVAGEINRLPEPIREATIAEVRAGTVRTVADVKRRRLPIQTPTVSASPLTESQATRQVPTPPPALSCGNGSDVASDGVDTTHRVISLTPESASDVGTPLTALPDSAVSDRVISLGSTNPVAGLLEQIEAIRALVGIVEAETPAGQALLKAVGYDLSAAYERLAGYLGRQDQHGQAL